ncbi:hypothetical protein [Rhodococcus sp. BS-15]|uniref:hypothetical protein n=1 Tax=Rhodococcus sp. BS-15 TaxID=1304954 RepID=UPI000AFE9EC5|nr:hypothetical protein [Rhodococcus sp. BS-15]
MKPYIDRKGRPELIVNPAIKLGLASFRPQEPADTVEGAVPTPPPSRRRPRAKKKLAVVESATRQPSVEAVERAQPTRRPTKDKNRTTGQATERRNPPPKQKGMAPPQPVHLQ